MLKPCCNHVETMLLKPCFRVQTYALITQSSKPVADYTECLADFTESIARIRFQHTLFFIFLQKFIRWVLYAMYLRLSWLRTYL